MDRREEIAIIGGGNWGSAIAKKIAQNLLQKPSSEKTYGEYLVMWIYEELIEGRPLTDVINATHENVKYLPGILLPENIRASSDLVECVSQKKILFFVIPHQFLRNILSQIRNLISPDTICVSLIKGVEVSPIDFQIKRFTSIIEEELGVTDCVAVMGANVATDVAHDRFAEATVACLKRENAISVAELLECDSFRTEITYDISSVELCGALKNVYALGAGFCDGMQLGPNAKAALLRQAMKEMTEFCKKFDQTGHFKIETMLRSSGVADLIATCYAGRNHRCSVEFYRRCQLDRLSPLRAKQKDSDEEELLVSTLWQEVERDLLNGQKLQGVSTCHEIALFMNTTEYWTKHPDHFPLFQHIHHMIRTGRDFDKIFHFHHAVHFTHR